MANLRWYGPQVLRRIEARLENAMDAIAAQITMKAQDSMRGSKSGHPVPSGYKGYGMRRKKQYPAGRIPGWGATRSAPGEAPAVQTSRLVASIGWIRLGLFRRRIGTDVKYGHWLEFGVKGGKTISPKRKKALAFIVPSGQRIVRRRVIQGSIAKRPWLRPAVDRIRPGAERLIARVMRGAV